jgi:nucleotide-binding universal stress UspA family protein
VKILVAVDDSPFSEEAVDFVARTEWGPDTEVTVLSVARSPVMLSTDLYAAAVTYDDELMKKELANHQSIASRAESKLKPAHPRTRSLVTYGDPRIEILETARQVNSDLIVVGSHGRTGISKLIMGSVASYVATHAPCSVLVVKQRDSR